VNFSVPVYQAREGAGYVLISVGLGPFTHTRRGPSPQKAQSALLDHLRQQAREANPRDLPWLQVTRGTRLERVRIDVNLRASGRKRRHSGLCPLIVEPRWASEDRRFVIAYHPMDQGDWFPLREDEPLDQQAALFFQKVWASLDEEEVQARWSSGKDFLKIISFSAETKNLIDQLPGRQKSVWEDLSKDPARKDPKKAEEKKQRRLPKVGVDLTTRALEGGLPGGLPRPPYRERLQQLLGGARKQPTLLVGPSGCGKTTLLHRWIHDQIASDDFSSHRNADRIHHVWALAGRRLIAGMAHVGEWEEQCMEILDEVRHRKVILYVEDVAHFGRIGRSRGSDRCLADLFQGPAKRGEVVLVGECTAEQLRALEDDAPAFVGAFHLVHVAPASPEETFRMLLHEARYMEQREEGKTPPVSPQALRTILELGGALFPNRATPGKALEVLRQLAREDFPEDLPELGPSQVIRHLAKKTGLPEALLRPDEPLVASDLQEELGRQVIGQPAALEAASDLIVRIKTGLVDPRRPYGVYLFTGPTGTGKTELAKCIAEYLYGDASRLVRFDMSEYGGYDGPARLIGDRWQPEGLLIQRVQEQPFCVVLFDEIEKAHPSILNLLLQLFDEGRLTSASGSTASFTHAVIVMTSNLGARPTAPAGFGDQGERVSQDIAWAVRDFFPPELFNRIDRIVPFNPLTREVATAVAFKEMNRLFNRRGLSDRNIFVYATGAVAELIAREAFAQQDGARSLKRFIEERIGSVLADHISRGGQAAMQVVRIFEASGSLQIDIEPLLEAQPADAFWALEPLLDAPLSELLRHLASVLRFLDELEDREELRMLSEQIRLYLREHNQGQTDRADDLYNLDTIRDELRKFRAHVAAMLQPQDQGHELLEVKKFSHMEVTYPGYKASPRDGEVRRSRLFDRRALAGAARQPTRQDALMSLAEVEFLRRALAGVHDAGRHAVFLELSRVSRGAPPSRFGRASDRLLHWLAQAYAAARGEVEEVVIRLDRGDVIELRGADLGRRMAEWFAQGAERVVLKIIGLCVHDFFALETGSHVWQSMADQPEIVQVQVSPAPAGVAGRSLLDAYDQARAAFEEGLRRGSPPPNPDRLLPAVRKIRFDLPRRPGAVALLDLEDYVLSHGTSLWVRSLDEALPSLWMLRMSGRPRHQAEPRPLSGLPG
jgi:ATP-dependent Clp protease ATP-binding subunit ClpA/ATP-dependent Clp protease ATP-binding subunit ClpC